MPEIQQNLSDSVSVPAESIDSDLLICSICKHKYDCDLKIQVPHVLPECGHSFCAGCIDSLITYAQRDNLDCYSCPLCKCRQPVAKPYLTNWALKTHIASLRKIKRKRPAPLPPAPDADAFTCPRHVTAAAEVLCVDCGELTCIHCAFECAQKHHKCIKADAMQLSATGQSSVAIDAAFERGQQRIQAQLDDEIRQRQAAAARLNVRLAELCERTKLREDQNIKATVQLALSQKDARGLCQLLQAEQAGPVYDVDIQGSEINASRSAPSDPSSFFVTFRAGSPPPQVVLRQRYRL
jgi:hypothetical protein